MADEFADIWDEEGTDLDVAMKSSQRAEDKLFKVIKGLIFITLDVATKPLRVIVVDIYFPSLSLKCRSADYRVLLLVAGWVQRKCCG